jgi:hypothetical protein
MFCKHLLSDMAKMVRQEAPFFYSVMCVSVRSLDGFIVGTVSYLENVSMPHTKFVYVVIHDISNICYVSHTVFNDLLDFQEISLFLYLILQSRKPLFYILHFRNLLELSYFEENHKYDLMMESRRQTRGGA